MTIFRGRMNHHFRAVLAIVWEDVTSSMLAQPKKISICPRAQKIQLCNIFRGRMDHYLGAYGSYSRLIGDVNMFAKR